MNQEKNYNENTVVTVGILKEILKETLEVVVLKPLQEFRGEFNVLKDEFHTHEEMSARTTTITMNELTANRHAVEHLDQSIQAFNRGLVINENAIKNLDARVLKLETAK